MQKMIRKAIRSEWGWGGWQIITEYRQTGGDADADNIVGMRTVLVGIGWRRGRFFSGDGYKIFYCVILKYEYGRKQYSPTCTCISAFPKG